MLCFSNHQKSLEWACPFASSSPKFMKFAAPKLLPVSLFVPALCLCFGCRHPQPAAAADSLTTGAAEIDITPPVGHRMAGYFDERLATGVHDPLKAKAIVLQQGQE